MPGPIIANPVPFWLRPENASVLDGPFTKLVRGAAHLMGLDDPQQAVMALMTPMVPEGQATLSAPLKKIAGAFSDLVERPGIRAFHGSPHDWPAERLVRHANGATEFIVGKPDVLPDVPKGATVLKDFPLGRQRLDKIGTGEGAQAFGHGLYEAEAEGTARTYKDALGGDAVQFPTGEKHSWSEHTAEGRAQWLLNAFAGADESRSLATTYNMARRDLQDEITRGLGYNTGRLEKNKEALKLLDQWEAAGVRPVRGGRMYEVHINADPEHFLDWDKPLSEQSEHVRKALADVGESPEDIQKAIDLYRARVDLPGARGEMARKEIATLEGRLAMAKQRTGAQVYESSKLVPGEFRDKVAATEALKARGIPGIRYLDAGSRAEGKGTYNWVVFDDALVTVMRKFGIALPIIEALRQKANANGGILPSSDVHSLVQQ